MSVLQVGVDVAKETFAVGVWVEGKGKSIGSFPNRENGFEELAQNLAQVCQEENLEDIHLTLEPTGGYETRLAYFAHRRGWEVSVANAKRVQDWAKGLGRRAKTDKLDALLLARYGGECQPGLWQPLPQAVSELDSLLIRRRELEKMLRQERNRQQSLQQRAKMAQVVMASVERMISSLERDIKEIERAIDELMKGNPPMQESAEALAKLPGVGKKTVLPLLVLMERWDNLTSGRGSAKGLTAYVGLDPRTRESGKSLHGQGKISKMGSREMRGMLYMAALGGMRGNNLLRDFYTRLIGRGKAKKKALVAAARKILLWAWAVYQKHRHPNLGPLCAIPAS